ncbi:phytanoyl-CoA dioxygenase family protein [Pleomorphovibrio marinus]|uniref:phytanoyl-CoA dioxygenase family protein n=1 Tax=Pleomorphovibrio marinus TaxID=2164132 RepID=UPI000E09FBE0|nr:phytanoyl-CoA dioxygenase family protein [Pleomorphovibrio marinus]
MYTEGLKSDFDRDGFIFLPGFLDPSEIDKLREKVNQFIADKSTTLPTEHIKFESKEDPSTLKMIQDMHLYDSFFEDVLLKSSFTELAEKLLGEAVLGKTVEYFNKPPKIGKATPPHQDGYYFMLKPMSAVTMWLALENVDAENGWVSYVKGSHKLGMRHHAFTDTLGFSQGIADFGIPADLEKEVFCTTKPGDLLVHHALTIHRASPNISEHRTRKAMGLIYFGVSAEEDVAAKRAYVKALNKNDS